MNVAAGGGLMVMAIETHTELRELDHRFNDGIDVWLMWDPRTNRVSVSVHDERLRTSFTLDVDSSEARDAFNHPYAYAGGERGLAQPLAA